MLRNITLSILIVLVVAFAASASSSYFVSEGRVVSVQWSSVGATAGDPVIKGSSKATGAITGVALNTAAVNVDCQVMTEGVFDLTVSANVDGIVVGDYVFASLTDANTSTVTLSETNTGVIFGQALEAIASGSSDRIKVRLMQSGD